MCGNYCFVSFLWDWIVEKQNKIKLQKKQDVVDQITKSWTEEDVQRYNVNHNFDGNNGCAIFYTKAGVPLRILAENSKLFTGEEYEKYTYILNQKRK